MSRKLFCLGVTCLLVSTLFSACKKNVVLEETTPPDYNHITWQMDDVSTVSVNGMEDNAFYVEHTNEDGSKTYYQLGEPTFSDNMVYYSSGSEDIPTLFLGQGDRLVYHTYTGLLQNIYFSRLQDLGYTIGIHSISSLENGRCVLFADSDHVLPLCTDAEFLKDQEAATILIDEFGVALPSGYTFGEPAEATKTVQYTEGELHFYDGLSLTEAKDIQGYNMTKFNSENPRMEDIGYPKLTADTVQKGILYGLEKDETYHIEFYGGTYYDTAEMKANIHMFYPKEHFHTNQYDVRQDVLFEVEIPEFENGIYFVGVNPGSGKTFRFIRETEYSIEDTFDKYSVPNNITGISSRTNSQNSLFPMPDMEESCSIANTGEEYYLSAYFNYETEPDKERNDNGISWYYQNNGVKLGRILNRHAEYFAKKDEATLTTVVELYDGKKIVRFFDYTGDPFELPESTSDVFFELFASGDYLFITEAGNSLFPRETNTGVIAINHTLIHAEEFLTDIQPPTANPTPTPIPEKDDVRYNETGAKDTEIQEMINSLFGTGGEPTIQPTPTPTPTPTLEVLTQEEVVE